MFALIEARGFSWHGSRWTDRPLEDSAAAVRRVVRIDTVDLGRGISVVIKIMVHTLWMYDDRHTQEATPFGFVLHLLGKGTASFLIAMGIAFTFSRVMTIFVVQWGLLIPVVLGATLLVQRAIDAVARVSVARRDIIACSSTSRLGAR